MRGAGVLRLNLAWVVVLCFLGVTLAATHTSAQKQAPQDAKVTITPKEAEKREAEQAPRGEEEAGGEGDLFPYEDPEAPRGGTFSIFLRSLISLAVIVVLIYLSIYGLKLLFQQRLSLPGSRNLALLETMYLAPNRVLYVVQIFGKVVVLGATEKGISKVLELDEEELEAKPGAFSEALRDYRRKLEGPEVTASRIGQMEKKLKELWKKKGAS